MAVTLYTSSGTPSDNTGVQGDMNIDYSGRFLWGPKTATTWVGTAQSIVGPTGPTGQPAYLPSMGNFASGYGPGVAMPATSLTSGTAYPLYFGGTAITNTYTPLFASACSGISLVNYGASAGACTVSLKDLTAGTTLLTSASVAAGTINTYSYGNTAYAMVAGHQYQWVVTPATSGSYTVQVCPVYLQPSSIASALSVYPAGVVTSSTSAASGSTIYTQPPGLTGQTLYYKNANASYLYYVTITMTGSGPVAPFIYNGTASANQWATAPATTLSSTPVTVSYGPFPANLWPFTANSYYQFGLYASGAAITVTSAYYQITVGQ